MIFKSNTIRITAVVIILYLLFQLWVLMDYKTAVGSIKKSQAVTIGTIRSISCFDKFNHYRVDYLFYPKSSPDSIAAFLFVEDADFDALQKLMGRSIPLVYDSLNVSDNQLLLRRSDYLEYRVSLPDSLKWIRQVIE